MLKKLFISAVIFGSLPLATFAENYEYMSVPYNMVSVSDELTDQQCQQIFRTPMFYNIENDQAVYEKTDSPYQVTSFTRISTTYLSQTQRLFYGKESMIIRFDEKKKPLTVDADLSFVLNLMTSEVRGSLYIPGYCKGNIIGVKQSLNQWDNTKEHQSSKLLSNT